MEKEGIRQLLLAYSAQGEEQTQEWI